LPYLWFKMTNWKYLIIGELLLQNLMIYFQLLLSLIVQRLQIEV
jgi:hypothetical protein